MAKAEERKAIIASRLREARRMAGLSQAQVAKMLGLHRPSITESEAGNRRDREERRVGKECRYRWSPYQ